MSLRNEDNRYLLIGAEQGDQLCEDELERRGNTIVDGKLQKTMKGSELYNQETIAADDVVTVTNGKITAVNGNPYP